MTRAKIGDGGHPDEPDRVEARAGLDTFLLRHGDRAAEVLYHAALTLIRQAAHEGLEGVPGRWHGIPRMELRRLRQKLAEALELAHLAVALQEQENERYRDLTRELDEAAAAAARRARRAGTLEAEYVRVAKSRARRAGIVVDAWDDAALELWAGARDAYFAKASR